MNKEDFLGNIAKRLGRRTPDAVPPRDVIGAPDFWRTMTFCSDERLNRFYQSLTQLGAEVHVVSDTAELRLKLRSVLQQLQPHRLGMWNDRELHDWLGDALESYDVAVWGVDPPTAFADIDIGITSCTYAVADTGTLVLYSGGGKGRSVHLLPSIHLAVVPYSRLRDRMGETLPQPKSIPSETTAKVEIPSYIHFVTGPSRSSDIENDHSIGVHGPVAEIVVVVQAL